MKIQIAPSNHARNALDDLIGSCLIGMSGNVAKPPIEREHLQWKE